MRQSSPSLMRIHDMVQFDVVYVGWPGWACRNQQNRDSRGIGNDWCRFWHVEISNGLISFESHKAIYYSTHKMRRRQTISDNAWQDCDTRQSLIRREITLICIKETKMSLLDSLYGSDVIQNSVFPIKMNETYGPLFAKRAFCHILISVFL